MSKLPCFRERLNQLLTNSGKTIVAFAEFLGTSRQSLGYYLNGERIPDAVMVKQICERCNVSADWLLGLSDTKKPDADLRTACEYTGLSEAAVDNLHAWRTEKPVETLPDQTTVLHGDHSPCFKSLEILIGLPEGNALLHDLLGFVCADRNAIFTLQAGQTKPIEGDAFFQTGKGLYSPVRSSDIDRLLRMRLSDDIQAIKTKCPVMKRKE